MTCEACAKLLAPSVDSFVARDRAVFKQQLFDVAQTQLKPKVPANRTTDDGCRKAMAVI